MGDRVWAAILIAGMQAASTARAADADSAPAGENLEEVIVTGSRIQQRLEDSPNPVIVLGRDDIDRASRDAIGKVLQQLPAMTGSPQNTNRNNGGDGSTRVDLRGLGSARSLVLVNGRRFVYGGVGADTSVDVNMIPTSMLERIEVLGVGSSTIYGSDAIGGVVNFITREDYDGAELSASYAQSSKNDGDIWDIRFVAGQTFGRGYFTFGGELVNQQAVFQGARDYSKDTEYIRADGTIGTSGSSNLPQGRFRVPANNALGLSPGLYTRVDGSGEPTTAADFRPYVNPDDNYNFAPINYLQTPSRREYLWLLGGLDITENVAAFFEGLLHHRGSEQLLAPTPYFSQFEGPVLPNGRNGVPADNFYNPFGVAINDVRRRFSEAVGRRFTQDVDTERFVAGLRGDLAAGWQWELSATYGRNDTDVTTQGEFRTDRLLPALGPSGPDAAGRIVCGRRDAATGIVPVANIIPGCVPLNVFGGQGPDGKGTITPDQLDYVTTPLHDQGYNAQQVYELVFRGDWGAIQDRPIRWAVGATHRVETAANQLDPAKLAGVAGGSPTNIADGGQFTANEAYAETVVPLLSGVTAAEDLSLTAGVRYSDFSSFGSVTTYQGGLLYRPVKEVTLRAGYGTVFRAPPITNLFESTSQSTDIFSVDPCGHDPTPEQRVNCAANGVPGGSYVQGEDIEFPYVFGGNPDLQPEQGDSVSAGVTLTPEFAPGLTFSVDYWRTRINDVITLYPDGQLVLDGCANTGIAYACDRIERLPDGNIELLDVTHLNTESLEAAGYDFDLGYTVAAGSGRVTGRLMATYLEQYDLVPFAGADTIGMAGTSDFLGSFPRWRGLGYIEYKVGGWSASYQLQYIGTMGECSDGSRAPDAYAGCRTIDDVFYSDLRFGYEFDAGPTLTLAVTNATGEDPPRVNNTNGANTDTSIYQLLGPTYFVSLSYRIE